MLRELPRYGANPTGHTSSEVTREHRIHAISSESRNIMGRIEEFAIGPK
jgi:hypothetical protein